MKPKMLTLILIPTTIISVSGVLSLMISNVLWVMIFALFVITALIKFYVINRLNGKLRNKWTGTIFLYFIITIPHT